MKHERLTLLGSDLGLSVPHAYVLTLAQHPSTTPASTAAMGKGAKVAIIVSAATAAAAAVGTAIGLALRSKKTRAALPVPVQKSLRTLHSFVSRKPASWYEKLPTFTLRNSLGVEVELSGLGAAITRLVVPDAKGRKADVVLGYDTVEEYAVRGGSGVGMACMAPCRTGGYTTMHYPLG